MLFLRAAPLAAAEPPSYEIEARLDNAAKTLQISQRTTYTHDGDASLRDVLFHLYPNRRYTPAEKRLLLRYGGYFKVNPFPDGFPDEDVAIQSVTVGGQEAVWAIEGTDRTLLRVDLPEPVAAGSAVTVELKLIVKLPNAFGRFGWHQNVIKLSRWYPILAVHSAEGWSGYPFYPFHRPFYSDAAQYDVQLTVPQNMVVAHTGEWIDERAGGAGEKVLHVATSQPAREFTVAMSPDYRILEEVFGDTTIRSFYLPGGEEHARLAIASAEDMMTYFTGYFDQPYPYPQFNIVPVHLGYGGEQMGGMIFIDTRVYGLPRFLDRYFDFLVAHETGHQWIFNYVGVDAYRQIWLEEGVDAYFTLQYLLDKYGPGGSVIAWPPRLSFLEKIFPPLTFDQTRDFRYKQMVRVGWDSPVIADLSAFGEPSSVFSIAYGKGSRVLEMLRGVIGDEAFQEVWRQVFARNGYGHILLKDFIALCESVAGEDLGWFFQPWLHEAAQLDYDIRSVEPGRIVIANKGTVRMPATVEVQYRDGTQETLSWEGTADEAVVATAAGKSVAKVTVDAPNTLLDVDRINNHWPRQLAVTPVPFYWPLYDMPLFMDEEAYNLVVGPEIYRGVGLKAAFHKPYDQTVYAATDYEFGEELHHSRLGYQLNNVLHSQTTLGFEIANTNDLDDDDDDLASGRMYLRRELWPAQYGLFDINDHVTVYLARNESLRQGTDLTGGEDARNMDYPRSEAIAGASLRLNRSGPYPDPREGYVVDLVLENAGHFLGAGQYFSRGAVDVSSYVPVTGRTVLAGRIKLAGGFPDDKALFYFGGIDGLRGLDRKTVRGAQGVLGSLEYRFPLIDHLNLRVLDNVMGLSAVSGVVFADAGQAWFSSPDDTELRGDAGFGLRFHVDIGSMLEQMIVRLDLAFPVDDDEEDDPRVWLGINHAF